MCILDLHRLVSIQQTDTEHWINNDDLDRMASYEKLTSGQREPGQQNISCFGWKYKVLYIYIYSKASFFIFTLFSFHKLSIKQLPCLHIVLMITNFNNFNII